MNESDESSLQDNQFQGLGTLVAGSRTLRNNVFRNLIGTPGNVALDVATPDQKVKNRIGDYYEAFTEDLSNVYGELTDGDFVDDAYDYLSGETPIFEQVGEEWGSLSGDTVPWADFIAEGASVGANFNPVLSLIDMGYLASSYGIGKVQRLINESDDANGFVARRVLSSMGIDVPNKGEEMKPTNFFRSDIFKDEVTSTIDTIADIYNNDEDKDD